MQILRNPVSALNIRKSPKFSRVLGIGVEEHDGDVRFKSSIVEIWPFRAYALHPAVILGTVRSLWTWLWDRYHVPRNVFLVFYYHPRTTRAKHLSACLSVCMQYDNVCYDLAGLCRFRMQIKNQFISCNGCAKN